MTKAFYLTGKTFTILPHLLLLSICLLLMGKAQATVRRVDTYGTTGGNGATWLYTSLTLQAAINNSVAGDTIWIAKGTYSGGGFTMKSGVKVFGGFNGNETSLSQRNPALYPAYLKTAAFIPSGVPPVITYSNVSSTTLLDGVTVYQSTGGGILIQGTNTSGSNGNSNAPTIQNVIIDGCSLSSSSQSSGYGGGMQIYDVGPVLINVTFKNNSAQYGGALYIDYAAPTFTNVLFLNNQATYDGGAVYMIHDDDYNRKASFKQCVFYNNKAGSVGGVAQCNIASPSFINCTFCSNSCGLAAAGGALNTYSPYGYSPQPTTTVTNCVFWGNTNNTASTGAPANADVYVLRANAAVTYSYFTEASTFYSASNITTSGDPFTASATPAGADGIWQTCDDGLVPVITTGSSGVVDKGNAAANGLSLDFAGKTRINDVESITNGTGGAIDMGAYENQQPSAAIIATLTGSIGNAHTIPSPQELFPDYITSMSAPAAGTVRWQRQQNGSSTWDTAVGLSPADSIGFRLPDLSSDINPAVTNFRRLIKSTAYCNAEFASAPVAIRKVNANGALRGYVRSKGGIGISDIQIKVERLTNGLPGSPDNKIYYDTTNSDGYFDVSPVYFGDPFINTSTANFKITPVKALHVFSPPLSRTLTQVGPQITDLLFTDSTVITISGSISQTCNCTDLSGGTVMQTCPLDSVQIWRNTQQLPTLTSATYSGYLQSDNAYGRYSFGVSDPGNVYIQPRDTANIHRFAPKDTVINVVTNVVNINFKDTTTHVIRGYLRAGCNEYIGQATLKFTDVLPKASDGTARLSCFSTYVTTNPGSGYYEVRLPARVYSVSVEKFIPATGMADPIFETDLKAFFNDGFFIKKDSLIRNIYRKDTTLNLTYERPPVLKITTGLDDATLCNGQPRGYALMQQLVADSFRVKVYQGLPTVNGGLGCAISDTAKKVKLYTNVPSIDDSYAPGVYFAPVDTGVVIRMYGGAPNVAGNHYKYLNIDFADKYGRSATTLSKNVVVTGVKADIGTNYLTYNPVEIPMLVLHDPPGDGSYSSWDSSQTSETAFRMSSSKDTTARVWGEVKLGTKLETGIFVSTETEIFATIEAGYENKVSNSSNTEQIYTMRYANGIKTSALAAEVGSDGDIYVGNVMNFNYSTAKEVYYKTCQVRDSITVMISPRGIPAEFHFSERHINEVILPQLSAMLSQSIPQNRKDSAASSIRQWTQMIQNNHRNMANAPFARTLPTLDISGGGSSTSGTVTSTNTGSNTIEFSTEVSVDAAIALGMEIAGSGASAGITMNFRVETGNRTKSTSTHETTIGYVITDSSAGDSYSINLRKDPVYATPVFELTAGQTSCPPEPGTQYRDQLSITSPRPNIRDTSNSGAVEFTVLLSNNSAVFSDPYRTFYVYVDATSNPTSAAITINGNPTSRNSPLSVNVARGQSLPLTVRVQRQTSSPVFTYNDIRVVAADACTGNISKYVLLTAFFESPCSNISMAAPENGWKLNSSGILLPVLIKDYTVANLSGITLQYAQADSTNWIDYGTPILPASLNPNSANGTIVNWNTLGIADGRYKLRLKLTCSQVVVYSATATGIIDRTPPALLGIPEPTDGNYVNGDLIAFSYTEKINTTNLNSGQVVMTRLSNNTVIPLTVTGYENRVVVVPVNPIAGYTGETIRVIAQNISDENGNMKARPDTMYFLVGLTTVATGTNALTVGINNPVASKNTDSTINVLFKIPVSRAYDTHVNYTVSGTARLGVDYTIAYDRVQPAYVFNNGAQGAISIDKDSLATVMRIKPVNDTALTPDKTIIISLSTGGDYALGATTSVTGSITSEDGISIYTFTGSGNFNVRNNWQNGKMPLTTLTSGKTILINPIDSCVLNVPLTIRPGATLKVLQGKRFVIPGSVKLN